MSSLIELPILVAHSLYGVPIARLFLALSYQQRQVITCVPVIDDVLRRLYLIETILRSESSAETNYNMCSSLLFQPETVYQDNFHLNIFRDFRYL